MTVHILKDDEVCLFCGFMNPHVVGHMKSSLLSHTRPDFIRAVCLSHAQEVANGSRVRWTLLPDAELAIIMET